MAGTVLATGLGIAVTGGPWLPPAAAAPGGRTTVAPVLGRAASGGAVIVVLTDQHANFSLRTQAAQRTAAARADQRSIVSGITASGGTGVTQLVAPSAVAAHVSAAEVGRLRRDPAVAEIVPDVFVHMQPPGSAPTPLTSTVVVPRRPTAAKATACPFNPAGPSRPLQEPEAAADVHASNGDPRAPGMANSIATGKGVIIANDGLNQLAGNPNFTRPNGTHVVIDAPNYKADHGNAESYGDASSLAAQGTVIYQYSKALPFSPVPPGCSFDIKGVAPGASLVDLTEIDTPLLRLSKVIAGIDRVVAKVHADVISESFGLNSVPPSSGKLLAAADEAAVEAGVTVVESSGDSGASGTVIAASDDPQVIAAGAVDNFRLVAMNDGYHSFASNQMAALSSGGTAPTGKLVNLVAPGWYGGEAACADNSGGCPPKYPTEAMRGTSEAAPLIAGAAADVIQAYRDTHHGASPTPEVVQDILTSTATDLGNPADQQGTGLLDADAAVKAAQQMPGSTDTAGPGGSRGLVVSPWQLDLAGNGGSVSDQSVSVYNTSRSPATVAGTYRWIGPEHQLGRVVTERISAPGPGRPTPPQGATAAKPVSFRVPPGLDLLNADMIWPDPANANILQVQLFNPRGALVQESYDDPNGGHTYGQPTHAVPNVQHVTVAGPAPGTWTAKILWSGLDVDPAQGPSTPGTYRGPMHFKVSGQRYRTSPASPAVMIPGHSSVTIPLRIAMPRQPGDYPESVQFSAGNGARTSLPVARRVFIPSHGGPFRTVITSSVGRDVGQINTFGINVPAGRRDLNVKLHTADASRDNTFTFILVNPSGTVAATATTPKKGNGKSAATADLYTLHPVPGSWQIDVVLDLTVSGKEFTQTVDGSLTDP
ncbi:MAG TPA: S8 family serine peptidase [Streptosporangiaceae bacterium]